MVIRPPKLAASLRRSAYLTSILILTSLWPMRYPFGRSVHRPLLGIEPLVTRSTLSSASTSERQLGLISCSRT